MWHDDILGTIGRTPLVRLNRIPAGLPCTVLAKVEFFNPGASVKDRIGIAMIEAAEREGRLKPGGVIVEGTSGNTGAGLALAAIARGYRCIFTTTDKQSQEKIDVLRALGAEVIVCPTAVAPDDPRSYYSVARRLAQELPNAVYLNQYDNPANTAAHYATTGPELWEQTEGRITHFIAGAGTGGTISGTGRFLKEQNPDVKIIGVDPYGSVYYKYFHTGEFDENEIYPYLTEGVGEDILAGNMDFGIVDDYVRVTDKEAMQMTRRLAREEGLFVGQSCGMAMAGALQWMQAHRASLTPEDVVVLLFPDSGFRYLSKTYNDAWMRDHGFLAQVPEMSTEQVLAVRRRSRVLAAAPTDTLAQVIERMAEHGISQMPVLEEAGGVIGSLTEAHILNRLIQDPQAREAHVIDVMGPPFPVVPRTLPLDELSARLEEGNGAVLVPVDDEPGAYEIITKSDLISALARAGRNGNQG
ncbi:cystathionine beta-synthase [Rhodothermaceae bacterium RA]|nr:cystathionine beta-synthase [Rhodothermaceae bacterium RA]